MFRLTRPSHALPVAALSHARNRRVIRIGNCTSMLGWFALILSLSSCSKPLTKPDCEQLLLRYVELLAASDRPDSTALEKLRFKQQAREKSARDPEFAQCNRTVSRRQFECAMVAPSTDEFERCLM